jgi:hypothetical protein
MPRLPETLDRRHNVDLAGRSLEPWVRRAILLALIGLVALALANVFGQAAATSAAETTTARLEVRAPEALRGGLIYEARFTVEARDELRRANLVLDPGWFDGMTLNSTEPDPVGWAQRNGRSVIELGEIPAGERYVLRLQFQVNPTAIGGRRQDVRLENGGQPLALVKRSIFVYP